MKTLLGERASATTNAQGALLDATASFERDHPAAFDEASRLKLNQAASDLSRADAAAGRLREQVVELSPNTHNAGGLVTFDGLAASTSAS